VTVTAEPGGWQASLELAFAADTSGATRLDRRAHRGPFLVQRPFFPEGREVCHVYLLHPPGGLVGGDELRLDLRVGEGARALVTTPAAGKAYRTLGPVSRQTQALSVADGAALEWLPQETIVYDGAAVNSSSLSFSRGVSSISAPRSWSWSAPSSSAIDTTWPRCAATPRASLSSTAEG